MTLPRLYDFIEYWEHFPPAHISLSRLAKAYLKIEDKTEEKPKTLQDFIRDFQNQGGKIEVKDGRQS